MELTVNEVQQVLEALKYAKQKIDNYSQYPSYEYKRARLDEVDALISKFRSERDALNTKGQ